MTDVIVFKVMEQCFIVIACIPVITKEVIVVTVITVVVTITKVAVIIRSGAFKFLVAKFTATAVAIITFTIELTTVAVLYQMVRVMKLPFACQFLMHSLDDLSSLSSQRLVYFVIRC